MKYDEIIKSKIINIYFQFRPISSDDSMNQNVDFSFLNSYEFFPNEIIANNNRWQQVNGQSSRNLKQIIFEIEENKILFNILGENFVKELKNYHSQKGGLSFFDIKNATFTQKLKQSTIEKIQKKTKYLKDKYGLKECVYFLNNKKDKRTLCEAMLLFNEIDKTLEYLSSILNITNKKYIGKNMLSIKLLIKNGQINGTYQSYNNTININNKENIPLLHEYIHFIDKTTFSLILTGKTTAELYELKRYNKQELYNFFSMDNLLKIKPQGAFQGAFDYETKKLIKVLQPEIRQNEEIRNFFNYPQSDQYLQQIKKSILQWVIKTNIENKKELIYNINTIFGGKKYTISSLYFKKEPHDSIINIADFIKQFGAKMDSNNSLEISKMLDNQESKKSTLNFVQLQQDNIEYYQSQKEMLARTIEKYINKTLKEIQNETSTPKISDRTAKKLIEILKNWNTLIDKTLAQRNNLNITDKRIKYMVGVDKSKQISRLKK